MALTIVGAEAGTVLLRSTERCSARDKCDSFTTMHVVYIGVRRLVSAARHVVWGRIDIHPSWLASDR